MPDPDNPFWRFSCAVYAEPEVAAACIALQDEHGADVNLLLLAAWLGAVRGAQAGSMDWAAAPGAAWRKTVIEPLRAIRRNFALKAPDPALAAFRARTLSCELEAEQIRQAELFAWATPHFPSGPTVPGLARANLAALTGDPPGTSAALDLLVRAAERHRGEC